MSRILGLDYGSKRIGVAISDGEQKIAFPKPFIEAEKKGELLKLIADQAVEKILIGLPKSLSGKETKSAKNARNFGTWLKEKTNLPIEFIDERFTTRQAVQKLRETGAKPRSLKIKIDSMSAYILLESYLKKFRN